MAQNFNLERVRSDLPILKTVTYLNTGTVGIMPQPVLDNHLTNIAEYETGGHVAQDEAVARYDNTKRRLASLLGADASDIAFNRNATDGINFVAARFPLHAGDDVITSTEEHPAMIAPWLAACDRAGALLRYIEFSPDSDRFIEQLRMSLTPDTRIVALSHVSCETGKRYPVNRIREIVGDNVAILIDASQSVGQFPVHLPGLHADFVIGNGHKWLAGPKGTGFAWFAPQSIHLVPPAYFASGTLDPPWTRDYYQRDPPPAIKISERADRFEFGTRSWHLYGALANSIEYLSDLGWQNSENHTQALVSYTKKQLSEIDGVTVVSPDSWEHSSGLISFIIDGIDGVAASNMLWNDHQIIQRRVEIPSAVRVSCAYFNTVEDIDRLIEAVSSIAERSW